jgi:hypothetical protein
MKISEKLLEAFYTQGKSIRRTSWPEGDHIDTDGAEGGTLWYYCAATDELTPGYMLGFHDLGADDWEIIEEPLKVGNTVRTQYGYNGEILAIRGQYAWVDIIDLAAPATHLINVLTRV